MVAQESLCLVLPTERADIDAHTADPVEGLPFAKIAIACLSREYVAPRPGLIEGVSGDGMG
jgi:hypothetical protein